MTDPLAELEAADAARFEAMVKEGARWLEGRGALGPLDEHPAIVYTGEGYRVWLHSAVHSILDGVGVPALLDRLRAAEAQGDKLAEAVDTFRFAYMGQIGHVVIPDALAEMEDAAREWRALRS